MLIELVADVFSWKVVKSRITLDNISEILSDRNKNKWYYERNDKNA